ncbi:MAG: LysR family transcriptional regulator [Curvibacter sp.]|nr:LysR family transcriptional regulator [Curvibacter sp.]
MPLTRFTLRQFEAFVAVAERSSFSEASNQMGLTSSAVSQLVAELEASLGFRVFDRSTRHVELSSAGRDFIGPAQTVLRHLQMAESAAADVRNRASGVVRVGAPMVLASAVLPAAIKAFCVTRPKVIVRIRDTPVDELIDKVASGDLDLAVGPDRRTVPHVDTIHVFDSPWVLWCAPSHPLARRRQLQWEDLRGEQIVAAGRDHELGVAQMHLNAPEGTRVRPVDIVDNISTALGISAQGLAITLAPAFIAVAAAPLGLVMRRVRNPEAIRQVCIYRSKVRAVPPAAEAFYDFLVPWLQQWKGRRSLGRPRTRAETAR